MLMQDVIGCNHYSLSVIKTTKKEQLETNTAVGCGLNEKEDYKYEGSGR